MPILVWADEYSVGVEKIDSEHRKLIDMINRAYDSAEAEGTETALGELVADMINYATVHFATEGWLMKEYGYPESAAHMKQHGDFTAKVVTSGGTPAQDWSMDPISVFQFLADWLKHHIMETDKELGKFLNEQGVQ